MVTQKYRRILNINYGWVIYIGLINYIWYWIFHNVKNLEISKCIKKKEKGIHYYIDHNVLY